MARRKITENENTYFGDLPDLTAQQMKFVEGILAGKSASDAYRSAYDCSKSNDTTIWAAASKLRNDTKVATWLAEARIAHMGKATETLDEHLLELARLREIALKTGNVGAAVQAQQLRGKAIGHYVDQIRDVTVDPMNALKEIAAFSPALAQELAKEHGMDWPGVTEH